MCVCCATAFSTSKDEAEHWAQYPEDAPVPEGNGSEFSSLHWAAKAADPTALHADEPTVLTAGYASTLVILSDTSTVIPDLEAGNLFKLTIAGNRLLGNPVIPAAGSWVLYVVQDATGGRVLSFDTNYNVLAGAIGLAANDVSFISMVSDGTEVDCFIYNR